MTRTPIPQRLAELVAQSPTAPFITASDMTLGRADFDRHSNRLARAYAEAGVEQGDFVSICLPNSAEFHLSAMAVWKLGAIPQPISGALPERERNAILELVRPALVVGRQTEHAGSASVPRGFVAPSTLSDAALPLRIAPAWRAPTSGGSTGRPKVIVLRQDSNLPETAGAHYGMHPGDVHLVTGPLYHNSPFTFSALALLNGQHVIVMDRFDAAGALDLVRRHGITLLNLVPTMMSRILRVIEEEGRRADLATVRRVWHMAAPCPAWLKEKWIDLVGADALHELYSGTEAIAIATISGDEWLRRRGSVGRAAVGEFVVLDRNGIPLPPNEIGEIFMRSGAGSAPTYDYLGAERRERGGYESLGDIGWMDADGYLYLADRRTDLILTGGANIYPAEVEAALSEHPAVLACAVVGLPHEDLGSTVHAVVQAGSPLTEDDLLDFAAARLARYKLPRSIEFTDRSPFDDAGKVRRAKIRDEILGHRDTTDESARPGRE